MKRWFDAPTWLAAGLAIALPVAPVASQPPTGGEDWHEAVRKACEHRRYGMRLAVGKKIAAAGDAAVPAIRAYAETQGTDALPQTLVESIANADTDGDAIRALLRDWAEDPSFYWRSHALGGLANRAAPADLELFRRGVDDPSHLYRLQAARGLRALDAAAGRAALRRLTDDDPDPRVRVRAAALLAETGDAHGLNTLLDALALRASWCGDAWGRREAEVALRGVAAWTDGEQHGYEARADDNSAAIAALRAAVADALRNAPPSTLGPVASVDADAAVSVRSCRHGDLFLAITADRVTAGLDGRHSAALDTDTAAGLLADLRAQPHNKAAMGRVVCDFLSVQLADPASRWKVGPRAAPGWLVAWLERCASALANSAEPELAEHLRRCLPQFSATEKS